MLDIMRKHASSWFTRIVFGIIIVVFIFFFGYSSMRKGMRGGRMGGTGEKVAVVNGVPISSSEFNFFYDRNLDRIKSSFEGKEIPEFAKKFAQSNTLEQIIGRELALSEADLLGIDVSDEELAATIEANQARGANGEFDPITYRHNFLPYFKNRFGLDYEQFVKQDLRLGALTDTFEGVDKDFDKDLAAPGDAKWTFEVVTLDPNKTKDAKEVAERLIKVKPGEWKNVLKKSEVESKKTGPITLAERRTLIDGNGSIEDYAKIFSLTDKRPVLEESLERAGKIYVIRVAEFKAASDKETRPQMRGDFLSSWLAVLRSQAKIKSFIDKEK